MGNWFGLIVFFAVVIANIVVEQKQLQKRREQYKKREDTGTPPVARPQQRKASSELRYFLDEILQQSLELELEEHSAVDTDKPVLRAMPATPAPATPSVPEPCPKPAQPMLRDVARLKKASWNKSEFRCNRRALRRAVIMKEVLDRPLGLRDGI